MATPKIRASVQLCSLDDVREWLKKTGGATEPPEDAFLGRLIDRVSMWFETVCNRDFKRDDYERYYTGNGTPLLWSTVAPIVAEGDQGAGLPKVEYFDGLAWVDVTSDYDVDWTDPDNVGRIVLRQGVWITPPAPYGNYRITLTAGYGTVPEAMPDDVRQAATIAVDIVYRYQTLGLHVLSTQSNVDGLAWSGRALSETDQNQLKFVFDVIGNYRLGPGG